MADYSPGNKPMFNPDGSYLGPVAPDSMVDEFESPGLKEQVALGVGKARYAVVDSKFDYRNRRRSGNMPTGKVGAK